MQHFDTGINLPRSHRNGGFARCIVFVLCLKIIINGWNCKIYLTKALLLKNKLDFPHIMSCHEINFFCLGGSIHLTGCHLYFYILLHSVYVSRAARWRGEEGMGRISEKWSQLRSRSRSQFHRSSNWLFLLHRSYGGPGESSVKLPTFAKKSWVNV